MTTTSAIISDINTFISGQNSNRGGVEAGGSILPLDYNALTGSVPAGGNAVTGISGIASGAPTITLPAGQAGNAVIVDGAISATSSNSGTDSYSLVVSAAGVETLYDNNTGFSETINGASYFVFDGGAKASSGAYQSTVLVESGVFAQVASMYNAAFGRVPDFAGLEYNATPVANNTLSLHDLAADFLASPEFANLYLGGSGSAASIGPADNGGPNDVEYIDKLYGQILHRAPSAAEVAYYVDALQGKLVVNGVSIPAADRADLLIYFSISPENQNDVSATNGGWLINPGNGAVTLGTPAPGSVAASTELNVGAGGTIDTAAIDPSSATSSVSVNGGGGLNGGGVTLVSGAVYSAESSITIELSSQVNQADVTNTNGDTIYTGADGHAYLITYGLGGNTLHLSGSDDFVINANPNGIDLGAHGVPQAATHAVPVAQTVYGFVAGDSISFSRVGGGVMDIISTVPTTPVLGSSLLATNAAPGAANFGSNTIVINVGTVTDASAAAMAAAASKVYTPTTTAYGDSGDGSESVLFYGQGPNNDTVIYKWFADTTHTVSAATMVGGVDLIGVSPSHLIANSGSSLSIS